ncbi:MAG: aminopeptidase P family protein [Treponema sp.]|jgi:Xaa-Pro aminopeptidase|nr:aminopeptidase P family protein [Treponema sp.]
MTLEELDAIQEAICGEGHDGWLFCNFHHRDKLSDEILHITPLSTNSRLWVYVIPARGDPLKIVHGVEVDALDGLPGQQVVYRSRDAFIAALKPLGNKQWGAHVSETLTAVSYLDAGTAATFAAAGLRLVSAAGLVQRFKGLLDSRGIETHEKAATHLYDMVKVVWDRIEHAYTHTLIIHEGDIRALMQEEMHKRNLITDHPPIVGAGVHSGNPHYDFSGSGAVIQAGDVLQFDLWAKDAAEGSVYADISWVGVFGASADPKVEKAFADLISAREGAYRFIEAELQAGRRPSGAAVDQRTREILTGGGYEAFIKHRTGHGIDTECHGSGVNIDSVEFPDSRLLLDGSCFSLEPGIYFSDFGLRTEIDVYIVQGKPMVSGQERQFSLLTVKN